MSRYKLSYVLTNYNKLPYLKEVMKGLLENVKEDEEIVATDGASTDGSAEYLGNLFRQGKIHQYLSEKDLGEAHGFNKAILMAQGELIKIISSDDIYYYPAIQRCREYMLSHPDIDVCLANIASSYLGDYANPFYIKNPYSIRTSVIDGKKQVIFDCGLALLIRKTQLPRLGLFNPNFVMVDYEYSYRNASIARYAYHHAPMVVRLLNADSNIVNTNPESRQLEYRRVDFMYGKSKLMPAYEYPVSQLFRALLSGLYRKIYFSSKPANELTDKTLSNKMYLSNEETMSNVFFSLTAWMKEESKRIGQKITEL